MRPCSPAALVRQRKTVSGLSISHYSLGTQPLSYTWSFGDGASGSGATVSHTYADNGAYTATLTIQAVNSLTSTVTRAVTVTNLAPLIQSVINSGPIIAGNPVRLR